MFISRTPFKHEHPHALALYCSDGRFASAVEELAASLGEPRIDEMCLPGGPGLLDDWTSPSILETGLVEDAVRFLVVGHGTRTVLIVSHEGCGFYKARFPDITEVERRERQMADLLRVRTRLQRSHQGVVVQAFYASVRGSELVFEAVG